MAATLADIQNRLGIDTYLIYKDQGREPYIESNFGYRGDIVAKPVALAIKLQCHECGNYYEFLGQHIRKHKISSEDYRAKHGLAQNIPLCNKRVSSIFSRNAEENGLRLKGIKNLHLGRKNYKNRHTNHPTSVLNRSGLCSDEQIRARLQILANQVGRSPSKTDAEKYDTSLPKILSKRYGSWNKGKEELGFKLIKNKGNTQYTDEFLLSKLRAFTYKYKKLPSGSSHNKSFFNFCGVSRNTIARRFGSWRRAKMMAGLSQLLEEVKTK